VSCSDVGVGRRPLAREYVKAKATACVVEETGWKLGAPSSATPVASGIQKVGREVAGVAGVEGVEDVLVVRKRLGSDLAQVQVQEQERRGTVAQRAHWELKMGYRSCREGQGGSSAARKCESVDMTSRLVSMLQLMD
jgi:hypothetical protein